MNTSTTYPNPKEVSQEFSLKEKITYTLLTGLVVGACVHYGVKYLKNKKEAASDAKSFEDGSPATIAKQIKMTFENDGMPGTDTKKLRFVLTKIQSKDDFDSIAKEYHNQFQSLLFQEMKKELQSTEYDEMLQIKEGKPQKRGGQVSGQVKYLAWAKRLKAGFDKMYGFIPGTDEDCIRTVFNEIPSQRSFINVGVAYYKEFKRNLMDDLKAEFNSFTYPVYLQMITNKPKA